MYAMNGVTVRKMLKGGDISFFGRKAKMSLVNSQDIQDDSTKTANCQSHDSPSSNIYTTFPRGGSSTGFTKGGVQVCTSS